VTPLAARLAKRAMRHISGAPTLPKHARALAPAIRVNAVCPGLIETRWHTARFNEADYAKIKKNYEDMVPLATSATADDVADAVVWFIEGARVVIGELLLVDSGKHLGKY